jgi:hypothetical protein
MSCSNLQKLKQTKTALLQVFYITGISLCHEQGQQPRVLLEFKQISFVLFAVCLD